MIRVGDEAPTFRVRAADGNEVDLAAYRGQKNVVVYFYPKDFTNVCTKETCGFRDLLAELGGESVQIIGISTDSDESHVEFAAKYQVQFPLIADPKKEIAKKFDAGGGFFGILGMTKRITFVINKAGMVEGVIEGAMSAEKHVEGVRAMLKKLA
jgi:thioredoxin-dependent peroxiredoxin